MLQSENEKGGYEFSDEGSALRECPWQTLGELLQMKDQIQRWSQQEWQHHGRIVAVSEGYYQ
jgi:hypothetical protein